MPVFAFDLCCYLTTCLSPGTQLFSDHEDVRQFCSNIPDTYGQMLTQLTDERVSFGDLIEYDSRFGLAWEQRASACEQQYGRLAALLVGLCLASDPRS